MYRYLKLVSTRRNHPQKLEGEYKISHVGGSFTTGVEPSRVNSTIEYFYCHQQDYFASLYLELYRINSYGLSISTDKQSQNISFQKDKFKLDFRHISRESFLELYQRN